MKKLLFLLILLSSCSSEWGGEWRATTSNNDEYSTIYNVAQNEIINEFKLNNRNLNYSNFENTDSRRSSISETAIGHKINSWFYQIKGNGDTLITNFSCDVIYNQNKIGYVISNLEYKNPKYFNSETITIRLRYHGFMCPCAQWISEGNELIFDSLLKNNLPYGDSLFWYVVPSSDSIIHPIEYTDSLGFNIRFSFTGKFFEEKQFMNWEGEMGPAITFQYDKIEVIK